MAAARVRVLDRTDRLTRHRRDGTIRLDTRADHREATVPVRLPVVLGRDRGLAPVDGVPGTLDIAVPGQGIGVQHLGLDDEVGVLGRGGTD